MAQDVTAKSQNVSMDQLDMIVDCDAHVTDQIDDILPYIDDKYEGMKHIIEHTERPFLDIYTFNNAMPAFVENERYYTDVHKEHLREQDEPESEIVARSAFTRSAEAKLREQEEFSITHGIVNSTTQLGLPTVENTRMQVALANGYNNWMADNLLDSDEGINPTIVVPPGKPDRAAEEIDRLGDEKNIAGVYLPATGLVPPPGHFSYNPIYEAAQDNDLPILQHGSVTSASHGFPTQRRWNETYSTDHTITHPFTMMWNISSMIFQGVPARYPDLDFVMMESGIGYIPYLKWRMDDHYLEVPYESPYLEQVPSDYIDDQFYFTTQPLGHTGRNPDHLASMIEMAGPGNIMYASDLPHRDFDPPEELFHRINGFFTEEQVRGMMGETAAEVYDIN